MKEKNEKTSEMELRSYQKATLFLFYPFLIDFMSNVLGSFTKGYDFCLSFGSLGCLMRFLRETPLFGSSSFSLFLGVSLSFILLLCSLFLTLKAAKGKKYPIYIVLVLLGSDFLYTSSLYFSFMPYPMPLISFIISFSIHAVFVFLVSLLLWKYDKLNGLLAKERKERKIQ